MDIILSSCFVLICTHRLLLVHEKYKHLNSEMCNWGCSISKYYFTLYVISQHCYFKPIASQLFSLYTYFLLLFYSWVKTLSMNCKKVLKISRFYTTWSMKKDQKSTQHNPQLLNNCPTDLDWNVMNNNHTVFFFYSMPESSLPSCVTGCVQGLQGCQCRFTPKSVQHLFII